MDLFFWGGGGSLIFYFNYKIIQPLRFALVPLKGPNATWQSENCEKPFCSHHLPALTLGAFTPSCSFFQNKEGVRFSASRILCISLVNKIKCDNCSSMDEKESGSTVNRNTTQENPGYPVPEHRGCLSLFSLNTTKFPSSVLWGSVSFVMVWAQNSSPFSWPVFPLLATLTSHMITDGGSGKRGLGNPRRREPFCEDIYPI